MPLMTQQASLQAGESVQVELRDDRTGYCSFEEWSGPVRILLHIDGVPVEVEGVSGAGYGWDC